jgi:hypothetical protein
VDKLLLPKPVQIRNVQMNTKKILVEVALTVEENVDSEDVVCCCDYSFTDDDNRIISTEIRGYTEVFPNGQITEDV